MKFALILLFAFLLNGTFGAKEWKTVEYDKTLPSPLPRGTWSLGSSEQYNDRLWTFGGLRDQFCYRNSSCNRTEYTFFNDLWEFTISHESGEWKEVQTSSPIPSKRAFFEWPSVTDKNGQTYLLLFAGGIFQNDGFPFFPSQDKLWAYHIEENEWINLTDSKGPSPRMSPTSASIGSKAYFFGGIVNIPDIESRNDFWEYDIDSRQWTEIIPIDSVVPPARLGALSGILRQGSEYSFVLYGGGSNLDTWEFNLETKVWSNTTANDGSAFSRSSTSAVVSKNEKKLTYFGGENRPPTLNGCGAPSELEPVGGTYSYNLHRKEWEEISTKSEPMGIKRLGAAQVRDKLLIVGGYGFHCPDQGQIWNFNIYELKN